MTKLMKFWRDYWRRQGQSGVFRLRVRVLAHMGRMVMGPHVERSYESSSFDPKAHP